MKDSGTTPCLPEQTWVCGACGKRSRTRYGFDEKNRNVCDRGWDESCMMNAVLCEVGDDGSLTQVEHE